MQHFQAWPPSIPALRGGEARYKAWAANRYTSGMYLDVNNVHAYAYTGGKRFDPALPVVAFVHGAQHDHSVWILQSRYLAHHGYAVLAVDLPGHGRSAGEPLQSIEAMADWLLALFDAAGVERASVVGHSGGSLVALEAAARQPSRVAKLVLVGTAFPMRVADDLLNATRDDEPAAIDMINIWSHSGYAQKPSNPGPGFWVMGENKRLMERMKPGVLHADFAACNAYANGLAAAATIKCPTLFILGRRDAMTPVRAAGTLRQAIPGAQTVEVAGSGHALMAEAPDAVLDALRSFLAR
jgi:pimeloyl-ACP methyl ester carboxylesterase